MEKRQSIIQILEVPGQVQAILCAVALALTVAPYFETGADFGVFKTPSLNQNTQQVLKILGPASLATVFCLYLPVILTEGKKTRSKTQEVESILTLKRLTIGPDLAAQEWSFQEENISIGSLPNNLVVLDKDPFVSGHHGNIVKVGGEYRYIHTSETNPTIVRRHQQEEMLTKETQHEILLKNNDCLVVGNTELNVTFSLGAEPPQPLPTPTQNELKLKSKK